jgi:hypothetical protein
MNRKRNFASCLPSRCSVIPFTDTPAHLRETKISRLVWLASTDPQSDGDIALGKQISTQYSVQSVKSSERTLKILENRQGREATQKLRDFETLKFENFELVSFQDFARNSLSP